MIEKVTEKQKSTYTALEIRHFILLFALLFLFWMLLSGRTEIKFIIMGLFSAAIAAWISTPLLRLPAIDGTGYYLAFEISIVKLFFYSVWLLWQIIMANIDLAKIILSPKMKIEPKLVYFNKAMNNPMSHVVLGNSITLTPGTVTVDILDDERYVIHALTDAAAEALIPKVGEGEMITRVAELFKK